MRGDVPQAYALPLALWRAWVRAYPKFAESSRLFGAGSLRFGASVGFRTFAALGAVEQFLVGQHQRHHR
ncbi:MAG: hypothetical protein KJ551_00805, partial [Alphaproteobacteria bacterium]|nr:hypothetical protein [Alphaproteobacteria bacterium]